MPTVSLDMQMIKQALRMKLSGGLSLERVASALGVSKGVVAKYVALARAAGLDWPAIEPMDECDLEARLRPGSVGPWVEPDFATVHQELRRKSVTLMLLWQEGGTAASRSPRRRACAQRPAWRLQFFNLINDARLKI